MVIESKYNIGDNVAYIGRKLTDIHTECEFCGGTGEALDYQGHLVECPNCEGYGGFTEEKYVDVPRTGKIYRIDIQGHSDKTVDYSEVYYHVIYDEKYTEKVKEQKILETI